MVKKAKIAWKVVCREKKEGGGIRIETIEGDKHGMLSETNMAYSLI